MTKGERDSLRIFELAAALSLVLSKFYPQDIINQVDDGSGRRLAPLQTTPTVKEIRECREMLGGKFQTKKELIQWRNSQDFGKLKA